MNIEVFDGYREFVYDVVIVGANGSNVQLNSSSINNLTIEDNILSPFMYGSIAVNNVRNILETEVDGEKALKLAGNNKDYVYVNIMPKVTKDVEKDVKNEKLKKILNINCIFSINETQDRETPGSQFLNMMTFRDVHQQFLMENSVELSTLEVAKTAKKIPDSALIHLNDSERTANAGDVIKALLTKVFQAKEGIEVDDEKGFGIKKEDFETGIPILWSSAGSANAHDSLMYIANKLLISRDNKDRCLLNFCRYSKKFSLMSFSHIFTKQEEDSEHFVLETFSLDSDQSVSESSKSKNKNGAGLDEISYITEFKYTALNGNEVTKNFNNSVFQKTVGIDRNFCFMSEKSNLNSIFEDYKKLYLEPFKKLEKNAKPSIDVDHLIKLQNARPKIMYDTRPLIHLDVLKSNALFDMLLNGGSNIIFRCPGSTHRRSGRFIDIESYTDLANSDPAANLIGRWFVTSVSHVFIGSNYYNVIEAIKTYTK